MRRARKRIVSASKRVEQGFHAKKQPLTIEKPMVDREQSHYETLSYLLQASVSLMSAFVSLKSLFFFLARYIRYKSTKKPTARTRTETREGRSDYGGRVAYLSNSTERTALASLITRAGGENSDTAEY